MVKEPVKNASHVPLAPISGDKALGDRPIGRSHSLLAP